LKEAGALDSIAGDPATLDLTIAGPWLPPPEVLLAESAGESAEPAPIDVGIATATQPVPDRLTGTLTLHNANWKTDALATAVQIPQAVLHLNGGTRIWDPVAFVYGPLKGTARVIIPVCDPERQCVPTVSLDFPTLNAAEMQSTLLGSETKGTLLSTVIERLTPSSDHKWPTFQGMLRSESVVLGPVILKGVTADLKVSPGEVELTSMEAGLLGGQVHLSGKVANGEKPAYSLEGQFQQLDPAELCRVLELNCAGSRFDANGKVELAGYTGKELSSSANGVLHFDWKKGAVTGRLAPPSDTLPPVLARFDSWTGDAEIANSSVTLGENRTQLGSRRGTVKAIILFGEPPRVSFGAPKGASPHRR
jgi:hypothetical protein